jgi:hypothetical protein
MIPPWNGIPDAGPEDYVGGACGVPRERRRTERGLVLSASAGVDRI